ncbi:MAG: cobalamin-independent methionine synthase II family protein [Planctomycetota bacterium]
MTIPTTVVGSHPAPDFHLAHPTARGLIDATALVLHVQELAGLDLLTDGELGRFDPDHPETNGMIESFVRPLAGVRSVVTRRDVAEFRTDAAFAFRARPCAVVEGEIGEGALDLPAQYRRARALTRARLKFTLTGPHMLAKTLLDHHYGSRAALAEALAGVLADQVAQIDADVVQVDEANLPGHPGEAAWALEAMNRVLDAVKTTPAVHLCFGNYGGQTVQQGTWARLLDYLGGLHADHVLLEMTRRGADDLDRLAEIPPPIRFGASVIDVKTTVVESPETVARRIESAAKRFGEERIACVNPDCGFWMLPRSVAEAKIRALVQGRDIHAGR